MKEDSIVKVAWELEDLLLGGEVRASDYFDCLVQIRKNFEKENFRILCNGARYDVYPSQMSRQMGKGLKAYVMTLGKQALEEDLVNIFDPAEITKIGTVEQQKSYHNEWLKSLG